PLGVTVIAADNIWFSCMTMKTNPIHFDAEYASRTEFKRPLVSSCFTLALVTGQSVTDLTMNGVANLGWDEVRLPNPLFEGDTVYAKSEVLETRESKSRPHAGIVRVKTTGVNQRGVAVIEFKRTFMVWKRGHVPAARPSFNVIVTRACVSGGAAGSSVGSTRIVTRGSSPRISRSPTWASSNVSRPIRPQTRAAAAQYFMLNFACRPSAGQSWISTVG